MEINTFGLNFDLDLIWESDDVTFVQVTLNGDLRLDKYASNIMS